MKSCPAREGWAAAFLDAASDTLPPRPFKLPAQKAPNDMIAARLYHQKFALSLAKSRGSSFWHGQVTPTEP